MPLCPLCPRCLCGEKCLGGVKARAQKVSKTAQKSGRFQLFVSAGWGGGWGLLWRGVRHFCAHRSDASAHYRKRKSARRVRRGQELTARQDPRLQDGGRVGGHAEASAFAGELSSPGETPGSFLRVAGRGLSARWRCDARHAPHAASVDEAANGGAGWLALWQLSS